MQEWSDKLKLGKSSSAFVKKNLRPLPLTEVEFEADFFLSLESASKGQEVWMGVFMIAKARRNHILPRTVGDSHPLGTRNRPLLFFPKSKTAGVC